MNLVLRVHSTGACLTGDGGKRGHFRVVRMATDWLSYFYLRRIRGRKQVMQMMQWRVFLIYLLYWNIHNVKPSHFFLKTLLASRAPVSQSTFVMKQSNNPAKWYSCEWGYSIEASVLDFIRRLCAAFTSGIISGFAFFHYLQRPWPIISHIL